MGEKAFRRKKRFLGKSVLVEKTFWGKTRFGDKSVWGKSVLECFMNLIEKTVFYEKMFRKRVSE